MRQGDAFGKSEIATKRKSCRCFITVGAFMVRGIDVSIGDIFEFQGAAPTARFGIQRYEFERLHETDVLRATAAMVPSDEHPLSEAAANSETDDAIVALFIPQSG